MESWDVLDNLAKGLQIYLMQHHAEVLAKLLRYWYGGVERSPLLIMCIPQPSRPVLTWGAAGLKVHDRTNA